MQAEAPRIPVVFAQIICQSEYQNMIMNGTSDMACTHVLIYWRTYSSGEVLQTLNDEDSIAFDSKHIFLHWLRSIV